MLWFKGLSIYYLYLYLSLNITYVDPCGVMVGRTGDGELARGLELGHPLVQHLGVLPTQVVQVPATPSTSTAQRQHRLKLEREQNSH